MKNTVLDIYLRRDMRVHFKELDKRLELYQTTISSAVNSGAQIIHTNTHGPASDVRLFLTRVHNLKVYFLLRLIKAPENSMHDTAAEINEVCDRLRDKLSERRHTCATLSPPSGGKKNNTSKGIMRFFKHASNVYVVDALLGHIYAITFKLRRVKCKSGKYTCNIVNKAAILEKILEVTSHILI